MKHKKLTQQQADQYKQWWQSMPTMPSGLGLPGMGWRQGDAGLRRPTTGADIT